MTATARPAAAIACGLALQLLQLTASAPVIAAERAPGQRGVLAAADAGARVVIGRTGGPRKLDVHGYLAELRVDEVLAGNARVGETVRIVWEELSPSRPVRFESDGRVLVCLDPLPTSSIWRKRLPTPAERSGAMVIAARGEAFVREPSGAVTHALRHYLAMARSERESAAGLAYVVDLVAVAPAGLAAEALAKLAAYDDLAERLADGSQKALAASAANEGRPENLRLATLAVVGERKLAAARPELAALASGPAPTDAAAWTALGTIDDGLPAGNVGELLASDRADMRVVGISFVVGEGVRPRLAAVLKSDPSPLVRTAAVDRLLDEYGEGALDDVLPSLVDPDDQARTAAAAKIGSLGASVVPRLIAIVDDGSERAREGAIVALSFAGPDGVKALQRIHDDHSDERTRKLAGLALGRFPGHEH